MPYEMCRNSYGMPRGEKEFFFRAKVFSHMFLPF